MDIVQDFMDRHADAIAEKLGPVHTCGGEAICLCEINAIMRKEAMPERHTSATSMSGT